MLNQNGGRDRENTEKFIDIDYIHEIVTNQFPDDKFKKREWLNNRVRMLFKSLFKEDEHGRMELRKDDDPNFTSIFNYSPLFWDDEDKQRNEVLLLVAILIMSVAFRETDRRTGKNTYELEAAKWKNVKENYKKLSKESIGLDKKVAQVMEKYTFSGFKVNNSTILSGGSSSGTSAASNFFARGLVAVMGSSAAAARDVSDIKLSVQPSSEQMKTAQTEYTQLVRAAESSKSDDSGPLKLAKRVIMVYDFIDSKSSENSEKNILFQEGIPKYLIDEMVLSSDMDVELSEILGDSYMKHISGKDFGGKDFEGYAEATSIKDVATLSEFINKSKIGLELHEMTPEKADDLLDSAKSRKTPETGSGEEKEEEDFLAGFFGSGLSGGASKYLILNKLFKNKDFQRMMEKTGIKVGPINLFDDSRDFVDILDNIWGTTRPKNYFDALMLIVFELVAYDGQLYTYLNGLSPDKLSSMGFNSKEFYLKIMTRPSRKNTVGFDINELDLDSNDPATGLSRRIKNSIDFEVKIKDKWVKWLNHIKTDDGLVEAYSCHKGMNEVERSQCWHNISDCFREGNVGWAEKCLILLANTNDKTAFSVDNIKGMHPKIAFNVLYSLGFKGTRTSIVKCESTKSWKDRVMGNNIEVGGNKVDVNGKMNDENGDEFTMSDYLCKTHWTNVERKLRNMVQLVNSDVNILNNPDVKEDRKDTEEKNHMGVPYSRKVQGDWITQIQSNVRNSLDAVSNSVRLTMPTFGYNIASPGVLMSSGLRGGALVGGTKLRNYPRISKSLRDVYNGYVNVLKRHRKKLGSSTEESIEKVFVDLESKENKAQNMVEKFERYADLLKTSGDSVREVVTKDILEDAFQKWEKAHSKVVKRAMNAFDIFQAMRRGADDQVDQGVDMQA